METDPSDWSDTKATMTVCCNPAQDSIQSAAEDTRNHQSKHTKVCLTTAGLLQLNRKEPRTNTHFALRPLPRQQHGVCNHGVATRHPLPGAQLFVAVSDRTRGRKWSPLPPHHTAQQLDHCLAPHPLAPPAPPPPPAPLHHQQHHPALVLVGALVRGRKRMRMSRTTRCRHAHKPRPRTPRWSRQ